MKKYLLTTLVITAFLLPACSKQTFTYSTVHPASHSANDIFSH